MLIYVCSNCPECPEYPEHVQRQNPESVESVRYGLYLSPVSELYRPRTVLYLSLGLPQSVPSG